MMKPVMVVIFSVFDIILGMASVGVQVKYILVNKLSQNEI
jgi:hypothetical protein